MDVGYASLPFKQVLQTTDKIHHIDFHQLSNFHIPHNVPDLN